MFFRLLTILTIAASVGYFFVYVAPYSSVEVKDKDISFEYLYNDIVKSQAPETPYPLIVVFHDSGGNARSLRSAINEVYAPARIIYLEASNGFKTGKTWYKSAENLKEVVEEIHLAIETLITQYQTKGQPILVGAGQGGEISSFLALLYPKNYQRTLANFKEPPPKPWPEVNDYQSWPPYHLFLTGSRENSYSNAMQSFIQHLKSGGVRTEVEFFEGNEVWSEEMTDKLTALVGES